MEDLKSYNREAQNIGKIAVYQKKIIIPSPWKDANVIIIEQQDD